RARAAAGRAVRGVLPAAARLSRRLLLRSPGAALRRRKPRRRARRLRARREGRGGDRDGEGDRADELLPRRWGALRDALRIGTARDTHRRRRAAAAPSRAPLMAAVLAEDRDGGVRLLTLDRPPANAP